ncbi:MAG: tetratricopeptide repeat protein [Pontibacterium sp.]
MNIRILALAALLFSGFSFSALELDTDSLRAMAADNPKDAKIRVVLVRQLLQLGDNQQAAEVLEEIRQINAEHPGLITLTRQLSARHARQQQLAQAGIDNPYNQDEVTTALQALVQNKNYDVLDNTLTWLHNQAFPLSTAGKLIHARRLLTTGQYEAAYRLARELESTATPDVSRLLATSCHRLNKTTCAIKNYQQLWAQEHQRADGLLLAENLLKARRLSEAQVIFKALQAQDPGHPDIAALGQQLSAHTTKATQTLAEQYKQAPNAANLRALASALYNSDQKIKALRLLDKHLSSQPHDDKTALLAAKYYAWNAQYGPAINHLNSLKNPDAESQLLLGKVLAWGGQLKKSQALFESLSDSEPGESVQLQSQMMLGYIHLWSGNRAEATKYFEPLLTKKSPHLDNQKIREAMLQAQKKFDPLIESTLKSIAQNPNQPELLLQIARYYQLNGETDQAIQFYNRYLKAAPKDSAARLDLGRLYVKKRQYKPAFIHLERYAYQLYTADSLLILAKNYHWAGQAQNSLRVLESLLTHSPGHAEALKLKQRLKKQQPVAIKQGKKGRSAALKAADKLYLKQDYKAVIPVYRAHLAKEPQDMHTHLRYAFALAQTGNHSTAASEYYIVTQSKLNSPDTQFHYGFNLARSGNYREAIKVFKRIQARLPSGEPLPGFLDNFIQNWAQDWMDKNFRLYRMNYSDAYRNNPRWQRHKSGLFSKNNQIRVTLKEPVLLSRQLRKDRSVDYKVRFFQIYQADRLKDKGYKTLVIRCAGEDCVIQQESWQKGSGSNAKTKAQHNRLRKLIEQELIKLKVASLEAEPGDKVIHEIYMGQGVEKRLKAEDLVFTKSQASPVTLDQTDPTSVLLSQDRQIALVTDQQTLTRRAGLEYRLFTDSDNARYKMLSLSLDHPASDYLFSLNGGPFSFKDKLCVGESGLSLDFSLQRDNLTAGVYLDTLDSQTSLLPYLTKSLPDNATLKFSARNLFFDKLSCNSLTGQIKKYEAAYSRYKALEHNRSLWYSAALGYIDDNNLDMTGQFDYNFHQGQLSALNYNVSLAGWYLWNQEETPAYYSPRFYDSTRLNIRSSLRLNKKLDLVADTGLGYTFKDEKILYQYGIRLLYPIETGVAASIGCRESNSSKASATGDSYASTDCLAAIEYQW